MKEYYLNVAYHYIMVNKLNITGQIQGNYEVLQILFCCTCFFK